MSELIKSNMGAVTLIVERVPGTELDSNPVDGKVSYDKDVNIVKFVQKIPTEHKVVNRSTILTTGTNGSKMFKTTKGTCYFKTQEFSISGSNLDELEEQAIKEIRVGFEAVRKEIASAETITEDTVE